MCVVAVDDKCEKTVKCCSGSDTSPSCCSFTLRVTHIEPSCYISRLTGRCRCSSKPTEKPKELIIPLIQKNRWHRPERAGQSEESGGKTQEASGEKDSVESLAVKELIEGKLLFGFCWARYRCYWREWRQMHLLSPINQILFLDSLHWSRRILRHLVVYDVYLFFAFVFSIHSVVFEIFL